MTSQRQSHMRGAGESGENTQVERIYQLLLAAGYPPRAVDWLRQKRLAVIIVLAIASWALVIGLTWMVAVLAS
jgi:hypothetical protein